MPAAPRAPCCCSFSALTAAGILLPSLPPSFLCRFKITYCLNNLLEMGFEAGPSQARPGRGTLETCGWCQLGALPATLSTCHCLLHQPYGAGSLALKQANRALWQRLQPAWLHGSRPVAAPGCKLSATADGVPRMQAAAVATGGVVPAAVQVMTSGQAIPEGTASPVDVIK